MAKRGGLWRTLRSHGEAGRTAGDVRERMEWLHLLAVTMLAAPACAHEPMDDEPLYEEVLFAQIDKDKPKPKAEFPFDDLLIDDDVPMGQAPAVPLPAHSAVVQDWRTFMEGGECESVGAPNKGKVKGARRQPAKGGGFMRKNDNASFGTDETVALLSWVCARMEQMYPGTAPAVMGDISTETGGRLRPHKSHQSGRDADVGYYFAGNPELDHFKDASRDSLDAEKTWTFVELLLSTSQVEYFFIDRRLHEPLYKEALARGWKDEELKVLFEAPVGKTSGTGVIRHQKGHLHHLHVRFRCPDGDPSCR